MSEQTEMYIPPVQADELIREKIKSIEREIHAAGERGDHASCQSLLKERTRLQKIIRASLDAHFCQHPNTELRYRIVNGGSKTLYRQCTDCGVSVGGAISQRDKSVDFLASLAAWDNELVERAETARQLSGIRIAVQQDTRESEWWTWYNSYLQSSTWREEKRRPVLVRDNYVCQGCRINPATEVHHLTYDHVGFELLFELTSLCKTCHDVAHGPKANHIRPAQ